jgi:hypothetical protein
MGATHPDGSPIPEGSIAGNRTILQETGYLGHGFDGCRSDSTKQRL